MFDFHSINDDDQLTSSYILDRITEFEIFSRYCVNFVDVNRPFCSELRVDKAPSCRIYTTQYNTLRYKDFGSGENYDCWNYVMRKYGCNYYEALNIISSDFKIRDMKVNISPSLILGTEVRPKKSIISSVVKSRLQIIPQPWQIQDFEFWDQYKISFELLNRYKVVSAKHVVLHKGDKQYVFDYSKKSPRYGYLFPTCNKAYAPYEDSLGKWMYDGDSDNVEGWENLDKSGDLVILTKSYKDVMEYRNIGINAISLPSETSIFKKEVKEELDSRFGRIVVNLDNDRQGVESTNKIVAEFDLDYFYIDEAKDLSDYVKGNSLDKAKKMIDKKLKGGKKD